MLGVLGFWREKRDGATPKAWSQSGASGAKRCGEVDKWAAEPEWTGSRAKKNGVLCFSHEMEPSRGV